MTILTSLGIVACSLGHEEKCPNPIVRGEVPTHMPPNGWRWDGDRSNFARRAWRANAPSYCALQLSCPEAQISRPSPSPRGQPRHGWRVGWPPSRRAATAPTAVLRRRLSGRLWTSQDCLSCWARCGGVTHVQRNTRLPGGGGGWHKALVLGCLPLAAPIGLSPLLILTLCGPERVLVVSTEPPDDLSWLTTPGVGCPGDRLLPVPGRWLRAGLAPGKTSEGEKFATFLEYENFPRNCHILHQNTPSGNVSLTLFPAALAVQGLRPDHQL